MANESQTITYEHTKAVLNEFAQRIIAAYRQGLLDVKALATRELYNNVTVHTSDVVNGNMIISINLMKYWKYVEDGRQAYGDAYKGHLPPISAIQDWIDHRPDLFGSGEVQRGVGGYASLTPSLSQLGSPGADTGLAWAVATNIAKKGIKAKPILKNSVEGLMEEFRHKLGEALAKDVGGAFYNVFSSIWSGVMLTKGGGQWMGQNVYDDFVL